MKRQRVGVACDKCRLLKAKCDGRQPVCSRCDGYGFTCSWSARKPRGSPGSQPDLGRRGLDESGRDAHGALSGGTTGEFLTAYANATQSYEALIRELRLHLDSAQQAKLDAGLQNIQNQLPDATKTEQPSSNAIAAPPDDDTTESSPTYVGKASDIHFVHSIRKYVTGNGSLDEDDLPTQSYTHHPNLGAFVALTQPPLVPSPAEAEQFLDVYLSTIHIAYPFIGKSVLLREFGRFQAGDHNQPEFRPWLALFNFIFAIGSYYTSFPHGRHGGSCHYFRCWNTLGFAIRMGHSIGLHVENSPNCPLSKEPWIKDRSHWRRTWYSLYVLDRLLALQLGRPMAIHEADFHVDLPSATDDAPFSPGGDHIASPERNRVRGHMMDYFIAVIDFSCILGLVIRELYRPSQIDMSPEQMLQSTATLDHRLTEWQLQLPRHLRFDLGHTFEKSVSFKRQRNMLAVKFHHLRALIHRPFLCLPLLQMNNMPFLDLLLQHKERIAEAEYICIHEAQQTAHLLHNVTDERSLVHDFPWWQMISCLICASSILFVAETFYSDNAFLHGRTSPQALREDAESCLKVFEALSVNSVAAQKAADMLSALSRARRLGEERKSRAHRALWHAMIVTQALNQARTSLAGKPLFPPDHPVTPPSWPCECVYILPSSRTTRDFDRYDIPFSYDWPSEISRAMEWSVQFLDHPNFGQAGGPSGARGNSLHRS
ncbi:hypothetical protein ABOM_000038 [Aspergillus bombycis]|uniref:Zn(2)-C6 fungal-type domain-containing protein n=1 Tax=Aspergillus bombycis TaxID=109264 RepID=A0A1F8AID0_9EURO|nr:hypothetical protein ABOM_000038 [Aspergillus bombycis]OGM51058.1 hypothetical protein ABOM_000038 [Aspergillus bombycis]